MSRKIKVVVAMSGGVDSSVAAALLKEQGYEVLGMMLRLWSEPGKEDSNRCCTPESVALARRAAARLDIPFYVIDAKDAFRASVVESFLDGYARGETPNPCLQCNREIRWTLLLEHAMAFGADFMATGHYSRVRPNGNGTVHLLKGIDATKDQSYVLHVLSQDQLRKAKFPVGNYMKSEIRAIAESCDLPMAARKDSQDLCFLAGGDYRDFLHRQRPDVNKPGDIVDARGQVLGRHAGLANYTIGQRKGLGLPSAVPMYVLRKEQPGNRLVVGVESELGRRVLTTGDVNWVSREPGPAAFRALVKTRYTASESPATVVPLEGGRRVQILFDMPQRDITAGQAAVLYQDEAVIGGGIIQ